MVEEFNEDTEITEEAVVEESSEQEEAAGSDGDELVVTDEMLDNIADTLSLIHI